MLVVIGVSEDDLMVLSVDKLSTLNTDGQSGI